MQKTTDPLPLAYGRALIIGKGNHKVDRLKRHLTEYFAKIDLLSDTAQLNSLATQSHSVVVVTDTLGDILNYEFFVNIRSLHLRTRLLCLVDHISRETEKAMRGAVCFSWAPMTISMTGQCSADSPEATESE